MNDLKTSITGTVKSKLTPLNSELRRSATASGWPKDIANLMSVEMTSSGIEISYPDEFRDTIHELEYGNERTRPTAVIRRFMNRVDSMMGAQ